MMMMVMALLVVVLLVVRTKRTTNKISTSIAVVAICVVCGREFTIRLYFELR